MRELISAADILLTDWLSESIKVWRWNAGRCYAAALVMEAACRQRKRGKGGWMTEASPGVWGGSYPVLGREQRTEIGNEMEPVEQNVETFTSAFSCFRGVFWHASVIVRDAAEASQSLHLPLLIIPIIMAHCENLINNREDIVVAISHMVVGLCSVTTLPLASTYVCQKRTAMTSGTSAHLALLPLPSRQTPDRTHWGGRATPPGIWSGWCKGTKMPACVLGGVSSSNADAQIGGQSWR